MQAGEIDDFPRILVAIPALVRVELDECLGSARYSFDLQWHEYLSKPAPIILNIMHHLPCIELNEPWVRFHILMPIILFN